MTKTIASLIFLSQDPFLTYIAGLGGGRVVVVGASVGPFVVKQRTFRFATLGLKDVEVATSIKVVPGKIKGISQTQHGYEEERHTFQITAALAMQRNIFTPAKGGQARQRKTKPLYKANDDDLDRAGTETERNLDEQRSHVRKQHRIIWRRVRHEADGVSMLSNACVIRANRTPFAIETLATNVTQHLVRSIHQCSTGPAHRNRRAFVNSTSVR